MFTLLIIAIGVTATATLSTDTDYDVTTIDQTVERCPTGFGYKRLVTVIARGNARGLPLRRHNTFINATYSGSPCCEKWAHEGWAKLNSTSALNQNPPIDPQPTPIGFNNTLDDVLDAECRDSSNSIPPSSVWVLKRMIGHLRSPTLPILVAHDHVCVTIVARISPGSRVSVAMQHSGGPARFQLGALTIGLEDTTRWLIQRLVKAVPKALRNKPLDIVVSATQPEGNRSPVMIQWVTTCNPDGDEDIYVVTERIRGRLLLTPFNVMIRTSDP